MIDFLITLVAFAAALSILIAVHEFGHFWVARRLGVRVLRYSIGFGKPLWSWRSKRDETEYVIAALPLGGYVKMLDEREGAVKPEQLHLAFNRQPVGKRFAIVVAGPLFNFIFAVVAYWLMFVTGVPGVRALIGEVDPNTLAAEAGLRAGQEIVQVEGEPTPTWGAVFEAILPHALRQEPVELTVREERGESREYRLALDRLEGGLGPGELPGRIGLQPYRPPLPPVIGEIAPDSPAERGGLQPGDRVVAVDGRSIGDWEVLVESVRAHPGQTLRLTVERQGEHFQTQIIPEAVEGQGKTFGRLGAAVEVEPELLDSLRAEQRYGPLAAVSASMKRTWEMSTLTLRMLGEMLVGRASVENISGPITIAVYAKASAAAGLAQFLSFLAIVSVSLGVLNLLPIPILDGGHLFFFLIEVFKGSPLSEQAQAVGQKIGLAIILALMSLAFYNDLVRLAG